MKKFGITLVALAFISFGALNAQDLESKMTKMESKSTPMSSEKTKKEKVKNSADKKTTSPSKENQELPVDPVEPKKKK